MTVFVQGERDSRMAQVLGDGLDRIADPDGVCGVGMAEVMEAGFWNADLCDDLLKMLQDSVVDQVTTFRINEDKVVLALPSKRRSEN